MPRRVRLIHVSRSHLIQGVVAGLVLTHTISCGRTEPLIETITVALDAGRAAAGRADAGSVLDGGAADAGRDAGLIDAGGLFDAGVPAQCTNAPGPSTAQRCSQKLRFTSLSRSMTSCFVDVRMSPGEEGTLEWDCGTPTGRAEVRFPRARFTGVVTGDRLDVCFGSEFDWSDGCKWTSAQALRGALGAGVTLQLTYSEAPLAGQRGCVVPCAASGEVLNLGP